MRRTLDYFMKRFVLREIEKKFGESDGTDRLDMLKAGGSFWMGSFQSGMGYLFVPRVAADGRNEWQGVYRMNIGV